MTNKINDELEKSDSLQLRRTQKFKLNNNNCKHKVAEVHEVGSGTFCSFSVNSGFPPSHPISTLLPQWSFQ